MSTSGDEHELTRSELAWELAEIFDELSVEKVNEMLAKNVPLESLRFFAAFGEDFADVHSLEGGARRGVPNLLLLGYLLRVVEERLIDNDDDEAMDL